MFEVCGLTVCTRILGDYTLARSVSRVALTDLGFKALWPWTGVSASSAPRGRLARWLVGSRVKHVC